MNYNHVIGSITVSFVFIILFWKMMQIDYVLKAVFNFLSVIGFVFGFCWSYAISLLLYLKSGKRKKISHAEWLNCIFVAGIFNSICWPIGLFFCEARKEYIVFSIFALFMSTLFSVASYNCSEDKTWED